jgi:hypothetical protein
MRDNIRIITWRPLGPDPARSQLAALYHAGPRRAARDVSFPGETIHERRQALHEVIEEHVV